MKACQAQLLEMQEMEQMVEFLKVEVPQWEGHVLQVSSCLRHHSSLACMPFAVFVAQMPSTLYGRLLSTSVDRRTADVHLHRCCRTS